MSRRVRTWLFLISALGFGLLFVWGLAGLPDFGHYSGPYGIVLQHVAVQERHATNVVTATTLDYRGFDTMGEEFILFAAATGLVVLLREQRGEHEEEEEHPSERRHSEASEALGGLGFALIGPLIVLGIYIVAHGHLTPGGGFQGGVILAAAFLLAYLAGQYLSSGPPRPFLPAELAEGLGAAGFVLVGVGGMISGSAFLFNFLPLGTPGNLPSAGTMLPLYLSVSLEVAGALVFIFSEFLDQRMLRGRGGDE